MNLDTRAREAVEGLRTPVDAEAGLYRLHRTRHRRTAGKVLAAATAVAFTFGVVQLTSDPKADVPPVSPTEGWVLVMGNAIGTDGNPLSTGDEWAEPLADGGVQDYPYFYDASPATRRFLVSVDYGVGHAVMTPGRPDPLISYTCVDGGCYGAALGPGPDELTVVDSVGDDLRLLVLGPDGRQRRDLGPSTPDHELGGPFRWSPDGATLAAAMSWHAPRSGSPPTTSSISLEVRESGGTTTTLYEYSEPVPAWYDPADAQFADCCYNDWGSPRVRDLAWAPDSTRLAFVTMTVADSEDGDDTRAFELSLFAADTRTGSVAEIADLGRCGTPSTCGASLAWTPDGKRLTVLADSTLTDYDKTGKVLDSRPTDIVGPVAWLELE